MTVNEAHVQTRENESAEQIETPGIGLLNERPLHAALKQWYAQPGDQFEVPVDGYVIDIVRDGQLLEIQTRNFAALRTKLRTLVRSHRVRLIHPITEEKWILTPGRDESGVTRRKSPRRGRVEDLFREMVSFPDLWSHPNFSLEVLMIREEETRRYEGKRRWRRRGWVIEERRLVDVVERRLFEGPRDCRAFLPEGLDAFTAVDMAQAAGIRPELAQKMAYVLRHAGVIELTGKRGRANLYQVVG